MPAGAWGGGGCPRLPSPLPSPPLLSSSCPAGAGGRGCGVQDEPGERVPGGLRAVREGAGGAAGLCGEVGGVAGLVCAVGGGGGGGAGGAAACGAGGGAAAACRAKGGCSTRQVPCRRRCHPHAAALAARAASTINAPAPARPALPTCCSKAFQPLVDAGYLEVVYGGGPVGKYLCSHPAIASGAVGAVRPCGGWWRLWLWGQGVVPGGALCGWWGRQRGGSAEQAIPSEAKQNAGHAFACLVSFQPTPAAPPAPAPAPVHLTGSAATYDAIVWQGRPKEGEPPYPKAVGAELG